MTPAMVVPVFQRPGGLTPFFSRKELRLHRSKLKPPAFEPTGSCTMLHSPMLRWTIARYRYSRKSSLVYTLLVGAGEASNWYARSSPADEVEEVCGYKEVIEISR